MHDFESLFFTSLLNPRRDKTDFEPLRAVKPSFFTTQYGPVHDFIIKFAARYRQLPHIQTVVNHFPFIVPVSGAPENPLYYADQVRKNALRAHVEGSLVSGAARDLEAQRADEAVASIQNTLVSARDFRADLVGGTYVPDITQNAHSRFEAYALRSRAQGVVGFPTPWRSLTRAIGGLRPGDVAVIVARPSCGKTWLAVLWAVYSWIYFKMRVLFCSMEMPAHDELPRDRRHRIVADRCIYCYEPADPNQLCHGTTIPRQRLSIRIDSIGAKISPWRFLCGSLLPHEVELYARYCNACDEQRFGELRVITRPYVSTLSDLELAVLEFQPDIVIWDSAYLAATREQGKRNIAMGRLAEGFKALCVYYQVPGVVTWHFNRDVTEHATSASINATADSDELGRVFDYLFGLFRPPDLLEAGEAILSGLKIRDGLAPPAIRTFFELRRRVDFAEIGPYVSETPEPRRKGT